jgi:hypothetical protein
MLTLEAQQTILKMSSRATEDEKYVTCALTAGVLNIFFTWYLIKPFGLLGVAMGTMLAQLLTNNWYGVYRPVVRLKLDFLVYLKKVLGLWLIVLLSCLSLCLLIKKWLISSALAFDLLVVSINLILCGIVFIIVVWRSILSQNEKQIIFDRLIKFRCNLKIH